MADHPVNSAAPADHAARKGCSCLQLTIYCLGILIALGMIAYYAYSGYVKNRALNTLSPAERADFETWLRTPLEVPPELTAPAPMVSQATVDAANNLFKRPLSTDDIRPVTQNGKDSYLQRLLAGGTLSAAEWDYMTTATESVAQEIEEIEALLARPDYLLSSGRPFSPQQQVSGLSVAQQRLFAYTIAQARIGHWNNANRALAASREQLRSSPQAPLIGKAIVIIVSRYYADTVDYLSRQTSDTHQLSQLQNHIHELRQNPAFANPDSMGISDMIRYTEEMKADGFLKEVSYTPASLLLYQTRYEDYFKWLKRTLPPGDPRLPFVQKSVSELIDPPPTKIKDRVLQNLNKWILKPLYRILPDPYHVEYQINSYHGYKNWTDRARKQNARLEKLEAQLSGEITSSSLSTPSISPADQTAQ